MDLKSTSNSALERCTITKKWKLTFIFKYSDFGDHKSPGL